MNTTLQRLEGQRPTIGGFLITYPSGKAKAVYWEFDKPIKDTMTAAKGYAAKCLDNCLQEDRADDANRTNWPSVVAAIQRIVLDWNEATRAHFVAAIALPDAPLKLRDTGKVLR
jgi:hypothetical protein